MLLCVLSVVFSADPVYIESRLYYLPKSVANNKSQAIDLSSGVKQLTTTDFRNGVVTILSSPNNLAIFRISENLMPHKSVYQQVNTKVTTGVDLYITSPTNWEFINEDNPTKRVSFSIDAFCENSKWNSSQNKYVADPVVKLDATFYNGNDYNTNTQVTSTISTSGNRCTVHMPYTPVSTSVSVSGISARVPTYKRDFDICVNITGDTSSLPSGYYYTTLEYSVSGYYESPVLIYTEWGETKVSLPGNNEPSESSGTITVWAYIGDVLNGYNEYSFSVAPAADTYSMVLGKTDAQPTAPTYDVAKVQFYYLSQTSEEPDESAQAQKFKIYISPTSDYTAAGKYRFIKMNTEGQNRNDKNTIYYDLYLNTANRGYRSFSDLESATLSGKIGSAGVYKNNTYQILPKYTPTQTAASSTYRYNNQNITIGEDSYMELWELNQDIYLKVNSDSYDAAHLAGMYYSYMYLTLVVE